MHLRTMTRCVAPLRTSKAFDKLIHLKLMLLTDNSSSPTRTLLLLQSSMFDTKIPYPLSAPPIMLNGSGSSLDGRDIVTVRGRDLALQAICKSLNWPDIVSLDCSRRVWNLQGNNFILKIQVQKYIFEDITFVTISWDWDPLRNRWNDYWPKVT